MKKVRVKKPIVLDGLKNIGSGSYGSVYELNNTQAIKVIQINSSRDAETTLKEIKIQQHCSKILERNKNKNMMASIPKIYDYFLISKEYPTKIMIIMDYIQGKNIYDEFSTLFQTKSVEEKKRQVRQVCSIVYQIAYLLELLQKRARFTHRDLHLGNVMTVKTENINACGDPIYKAYLIDFGMSRARIMNSSIAVDVYYEQNYFNTTFDMSFFVYNVFTSLFMCRLKNKTCKNIHPELFKKIKEILEQTQIPFDLIHTNSSEFYKRIAYNTYDQIATPVSVKNIMIQILKKCL